MSRRTDRLEEIIASVAVQEGEPRPSLQAIRKARREAEDLLDGADEREAALIGADLEWLAMSEDLVEHSAR